MYIYVLLLEVLNINEPGVVFHDGEVEVLHYEI